VTRMVRRHVRRSKTKRVTSRHGRNTKGRGSTIRVKGSGGKLIDFRSFVAFPRMVARTLWANPKRRGR